MWEIRSGGLPRIKFVPCALACLFLLVLFSCQAFPRVTVEPLPDYDALFQRVSGWTGGDGAYSTSLGRDRFLWVFGDSFIGEVMAGRHVNARLVNNSIAIQIGEEPEADSIHFFYQILPDGRPEAFVRPSDSLGWFWPHHGVRTAGGLYLFFVQMERTEDSGTFGFRPVANWLGQVRNPEEQPAHWTITQHKIPWGSAKRHFGSFVLCQESYCYIFGTVLDEVQGSERRQLILARAPHDRLADFHSWRFFSGGEWIPEVDRAGRICEDVASELSVSFQPALNRYVLVYTEKGLSEGIVIRLSRNLSGPWSRPVRVYRCPEARQDPRIFCYAAKGHPEITLSPEELIVTYVTNSTDFEVIRSDASLYRPRFLRLHFVDPEKRGP